MMEDGKGEWIIDWLDEEAELCWYNLWMMWQSEELRANLSHHSVAYTVCPNTQPQFEGEHTEVVVIPGGDYFVQGNWTKQ